MIANLAGLAESMLGATGILRSISWLFVSLALIAAAIPVSVVSVRLSAAANPTKQQLTLRWIDLKASANDITVHRPDGRSR
jgi:hypothetical protein